MVSERVQKLISDLKEFARRYDIKQTELAPMLGIKPQQLNDWFEARREATPERVLQILELLKTKPKAGKQRRRGK